MAAMSMNMVIHRAFRRDLERFLDALASFRDGDRARADQLGTAWDNFDAQLTDHHEGEHAIAWPAMESIGVSKQLLATFDEEHDRMAEALAATRGAMATFRTTATAADASAARSAMANLQTITVAHLDHEEQEIEPIYLQPMYQQRIAHGTRGFPWTGGLWHGEVSYERGICPVTERLYESDLLLFDVCRVPLTTRDVDDVADAFEKVIQNLDRLRALDGE